MIPARLGSTRVKNKNLRLINQKPLIQYIIDSVKESKYLDDISINSEASIFKEIAANNNINLTSIDYSNAVKANFDNFRDNKRHTIIQCDINKNPFKNDQFDIVVCLGVVQHTPNPEKKYQLLVNNTELHFQEIEHHVFFW